MNARTTADAYDVLVRKDDLSVTEVRAAQGADEITLAPGQVLLAVDCFAYTANNITYGVLGDAFSYWSFFPAPEGWGRIPVWGFADVVASAHEDVTVGERVYGYLPMSTYLVVEAVEVSPSGFTDGVAHRRERAAIYNRYDRVAADAAYDPELEGEQALLRPLFTTAFLIDDHLADEGFFGADCVVLGSASSKTAYCTATLLAARGAVEVVGLTSAANVAFTEALGCYDRVLAYDAVADLDADTPTVYVDMSGDAGARGAVHRRLGDALRRDIAVGMTHHDAVGGDPDLPGPAPEVFFAPGQGAKRAADWGGAELVRRIGEAWAMVLPKVTDPDHPALTVIRGAGLEAVIAVHEATLAGRVPPAEGHVLTLAEPV